MLATVYLNFNAFVSSLECFQRPSHVKTYCWHLIQSISEHPFAIERQRCCYSQAAGKMELNVFEFTAQLTNFVLFLNAQTDRAHTVKLLCVKTTGVWWITRSLLPVNHVQITLGVCFILMFGNSMLLTSFYASSLLSIWVSWTSEILYC